MKIEKFEGRERHTNVRRRGEKFRHRVNRARPLRAYAHVRTKWGDVAKASGDDQSKVKYTDEAEKLLKKGHEEKNYQTLLTYRALGVEALDPPSSPAPAPPALVFLLNPASELSFSAASELVTCESMDPFLAQLALAAARATAQLPEEADDRQQRRSGSGDGNGDHRRRRGGPPPLLFRGNAENAKTRICLR